ncbi:hypothetical protein PHLGIDRAFT_309303 [Phlebiopsis gigantea 11061_1 CR5-6]|uniref:F-box domain-containing protein n=1 Tax=Phlebiopsis gigantea (strain 11061_1 CR5-6) TaxID=745531 RepID=A0A0C3RQK7_PHLG1|nr:hypothetical protein PHLGIDRAFT_309303 [Phlebiopsis gigantea 11061_1 CR5-6]
MHEPLPEILDNVLEFLHPEDWETGWHEKHNIHSCSLVSRTWHSIAHRHLFRDIVYLFLRTPDDNTFLCVKHSRTSRILMPFTDRPRKRYTTLPMFLSLLEEHPSIRHMIHRLRLEVRPLEEPHDRSARQFTEEDCVDTELFLRLCTLLPNLKVLHLCNVVLNADPPSSPPLPSLPRLYVSYRSNLSSHGWTWHSSGNFVRTYRILACFAGLNELHLHALGDLAFFIRSPTGERTPAKLCLAIRSLILDAVTTSSGKVYEVFLDSPAAHSLRCLIHTDLISTLGRRDFLQRVGPNLRQLRYELPIFGHSAQAAIFDIKSCTNLHTLTVGFTMDAARRLGSPDGVTNLLHFLSFSEGAKFPHLRELTFHVAVEADGDPIHHWNTWFQRYQDTATAADRALVNFAARWTLDAVYFECYFREGDELSLGQAQWMLSRVFAQLDLEGKLRFRTAPSKKWMVFDSTLYSQP